MIQRLGLVCEPGSRHGQQPTAPYWEEMEAAGDTFKGTSDINEGTKCHNLRIPTEALLAKQEAYKMEETVHPPARQWRLLKRRAPTGLYWLLQQMSAWPRRYKNQQWLDLGSILSLYR